MPGSGTVRWSDIPANRILEFDPATGQTRVHRSDVEYTNGRTLDLNGHVVQCSHGRRAVEREVDGEPHTIVDSWDGKRFNSPNDVVVHSDGTIWFTDPPYGIQESGREGHPGTQDYPGCYVFRLDEATGVATPVVTELAHPNGLAFSLDESLLYVTDTAPIEGSEAPRPIRVYDVTGGVASNGRVFAQQSGTADGLRVDAAGRVWTSSGPAVQVFSPDGELLLDIPLPETASNVCFGGTDGRDLYITASTSLYRVRTTTRGAR